MPVAPSRSRASGAGRAAPLILASASPRRAALLRAAGIDCRVRPAAIAERLKRAESPAAAVRRLALAKARKLRRAAPQAWILGADTLVVHHGRAIGKPASARHARAILRRLAGREHRVLTGLALLRPHRPALTQVAVSRVRFRPLTRAQIEGYLASGEPMDKAGGYAIQGRGAALVERVSGSYSNVVGMPLEILFDLLGRAGWDPLTRARPPE
ncbi:MAG TPA: Maf family protein [Acidobacteriota bacterium]